MFVRPYEHMSTADALDILSGNTSAPTTKCTSGWDYDRTQYETSITMDVRLHTVTLVLEEGIHGHDDVIKWKHFPRY